MQVVRRFSIMVMTGLIMILSIAMLVSIEHNFSFLDHKQWLFGALTKRQSTITFNIPWYEKVPGVHENLVLEASTSPISDAPHTQSVHTTTSTSSNVVAVNSNYNHPSTSELDCTEAEAMPLTPLSLLKELQTGLPLMQGYVAPYISQVTALGSSPLLHELEAPQSTIPTIPAWSCSACTTVTESWHSTVSDCIATTISNVAEVTVTVSVTVTPLVSSSSSIDLTINPSTLGQNNTILYESCSLTDSTASVPQTIPLGSISFASGTPSLHGLLQNQNMRIDNVDVMATTTTHPCPNAGYSCSECPGGWFGPPIQTPATTCPCGYGWPCVNCVDSWFCIPGPSANINANPLDAMNAVIKPTRLVPRSIGVSTMQPRTLASPASIGASPVLPKILVAPASIDIAPVQSRTLVLPASIGISPIQPRVLPASIGAPSVQPRTLAVSASIGIVSPTQPRVLATPTSIGVPSVETRTLVVPASIGAVSPIPLRDLAASAEAASISVSPITSRVLPAPASIGVVSPRVLDTPASIGVISSILPRALATSASIGVESPRVLVTVLATPTSIGVVSPILSDATSTRFQRMKRRAQRGDSFQRNENYDDSEEGK